jgi:hypothetical protein
MSPFREFLNNCTDLQLFEELYIGGTRAEDENGK